MRQIGANAVSDSWTDFLTTTASVSGANCSCRPKHSGCRDADRPTVVSSSGRNLYSRHLDWNQLEDTPGEQLNGAAGSNAERQLGRTHAVNHSIPASHRRSNAVITEGGRNITLKNSGHSEAEQRVRSYSATRNDTSAFHARCRLANSSLISGDVWLPEKW